MVGEGDKGEAALARGFDDAPGGLGQVAAR